jgi:hypothetical protein
MLTYNTLKYMGVKLVESYDILKDVTKMIRIIDNEKYQSYNRFWQYVSDYFTKLAEVMETSERNYRSTHLFMYTEAILDEAVKWEDIDLLREYLQQIKNEIKKDESRIKKVYLFL